MNTVAGSSKLSEVPENDVLKTVLLYSAAVLILPLLAFFTSKTFLFDGILHLSVVSSNVWSAVVAVVVLHIVLGLFVYRAFSGGKPDPKKRE